MKTILLAMILSAVVTGSIAQAQTFNIDPNSGSVMFTVKKLETITVTGYFKKFDGQFSYNPNDILSSAVKAIIQVPSLTTSDNVTGKFLSKGREDDLRKYIFLWDTYPTMTFESHGVSQVESPQHFKLQGDLTIRDQKHPVELDVVAKEMSSNKVHFVATTVIDRQNWGLNWDQGLADGVAQHLIADDVHITLDIYGTLSH